MNQGRRRRPPSPQGQAAPAAASENVDNNGATLTQNVGDESNRVTASGNYRRVSERLRLARDQKGESIADIANHLRIKPTYLAALENGQYDDLPANAYVIGFLRTYGNYLGLEGEALLDDYRSEMQGRNRPPQLVPPKPIAEVKTPSAPILIGSAALALLIYGAWFFFSADDRSVITPPQPPVAEVEPALPPQPTAITAATPTVQPTVTAVPAPIATTDKTTASGIALPSNTAAATTTATAPATTTITTAPAPVVPAVPAATATTGATTVPNTPPAPKGTVYGNADASSRLVIRAERDAWILIQSSEGEQIFSRMLKPGDSYHVPNRQGLLLTTGNAGGIVLNLGGLDLPRLGSPNQIARAVNLDTALRDTPNR